MASKTGDRPQHVQGEPVNEPGEARQLAREWVASCHNESPRSAAHPDSAYGQSLIKSLARLIASALDSARREALEKKIGPDWREALPYETELELADALRASEERLSQMEAEIRLELWRGHGHDGLYGDDGEMQCGRCRPTWDYKRGSLPELVRSALSALRSGLREKDEEIARLKVLKTWIACVATDSQLDAPVPALGGRTGREVCSTI